jgi:hypothetical protein
MQMTKERKPADAQSRGFTNDGIVISDVVNDSYGTVDPADSTGLDTDLEKEEQAEDEAAIDRRNKQQHQPRAR